MLWAEAEQSIFNVLSCTSPGFSRAEALEQVFRLLFELCQKGGRRKLDKVKTICQTCVGTQCQRKMKNLALDLDGA